MSKTLDNAIHAHAAVAHLLSDANVHHTYLRSTLGALKRVGRDPVNQAIMKYREAITPLAIRRQVNACKGRGYDGLITPAVVRRSATDALREFLECEIAN